MGFSFFAPNSVEGQRVRSLTRREPLMPTFVDQLSAYYNNRGNKLFPVQALALREAAACRGMFGQLAPGVGKTLISMLLPEVMGATNPMMVIPKRLFAKTKVDFQEYADAGYRVTLPRLVSTQYLTHKKRENWLLEQNPDLLIFDEGQSCREWGTVARRVDRYVRSKRERERVFGELLSVVSMSGTLMTPNISQWAHIARWCLGMRSPAPLNEADVLQWTQQPPPGFFEHAREVSGMVMSMGRPCNASITCDHWRPSLPPVVEEAIRMIDAGVRPDGELLDDLEVPEVRQQAFTGFFYIWDPLPPKWWLDPRRDYHKYSRWVVEQRLPGFDSASFVRDCLLGLLPDREPPLAADGRKALQAWLTVQREYTPPKRPVWLSEAMVEQAVAHVRLRPKTLIWCPHEAVGPVFVKHGIPYYGADTDPEQEQGRTIALSVRAHHVGKNLQAWQNNLLLGVHGPEVCEQLMARTHRPKQDADTVHFDWPQTLDYHQRKLQDTKQKAHEWGRHIGNEQKLALADWIQ